MSKTGIGLFSLGRQENDQKNGNDKFKQHVYSVKIVNVQGDIKFDIIR